TYEVAARLPPKFDLLFVVDDTTAMAAHQEALVEIAAALETTLEEEPDVNIAVTTASVAAAGELRAPPGTTEPYLSRTLAPDFTVASNFQGTLASALAALLDVGASGTEAV